MLTFSGRKKTNFWLEAEYELCLIPTTTHKKVAKLKAPEKKTPEWISPQRWWWHMTGST